MTPERGARIQSVLAAALEPPAEARAVYLEEISQNDTELVKEVASHTEVPGQLVEALRLDPTEDPVRSDARFEAVLAKNGDAK